MGGGTEPLFVAVDSSMGSRERAGHRGQGSRVQNLESQDLASILPSPPLLLPRPLASDPQLARLLKCTPEPS